MPYMLTDLRRKGSRGNLDETAKGRMEEKSEGDSEQGGKSAGRGGRKGSFRGIFRNSRIYMEVDNGWPK